MKFKLLILFSLFIFNVFPQSTINYEGTDEIFLNPERGFSAYRSNPITLSFINTIKAENVSVIQRIYTIPQYNDVPLPQTFLDIVQADLNTAREGGVKLVMRWSYTNNQNGEDAALDTILLHINQLAPVLQQNYDVINYVEAGFIGAWGEWYYSSHHLNNTESRRAVTLALLDALPIQRDVVVRTPDYKRRIFEISEPLDSLEAFSGSDRSRVGAHNDCFVADETDMGTYLWDDVEGDKDYLNQDNRYVPQGGETCCDCGYADCENSLIDLARMRWSVLNKDYNEEVLNRWIAEGCMDEVKRRLGYRFELQQATISDSIKPAGIFNFSFRIANYGFASPFNPRNLEIILRNTATSQRYRLITDVDPRFWMAGDTAYVSITAGIPASMEEGDYSAFIFLADPENRLHDNPDFAVRLANNGLWEDSTGYNSLNHQIKITNNAGGETYTGTSFFELYNGVSAIQREEQVIPEHYNINVYPNPFNGTTTIEYNVRPQDVTEVRIFDVTGRLIKQFEPFEYSSKRIIWNTSSSRFGELSSGVYFLLLRTKKNFYSQKLLLLK
ncbi:MAG TPA: DUF4832 domain-containing protein [Ignavibacteriaceae bacterium]|nr:DUF4832 domain-containing protein [Ignavibacteriaceae bacterium]